MFALIASAQDNATIIFVLAAIAFLIGAVISWYVEPRTRSFTALCVGLIFIAVGLIIMVHSGLLFSPKP